MRKRMRMAEEPFAVSYFCVCVNWTEPLREYRLSGHNMMLVKASFTVQTT